MSRPERSAGAPISAYVICYGLFALVLVLCAVTFVIWRVTILELLNTFLPRSYANRLLYQLGILVLGFALFIIVIGGEYYLRTGVERRQLSRRFAQLAVPLVVLAGLGWLLQFLAA